MLVLALDLRYAQFSFSIVCFAMLHSNSRIFCVSYQNIAGKDLDLDIFNIMLVALVNIWLYALVKYS